MTTNHRVLGPLFLLLAATQACAVDPSDGTEDTGDDVKRKPETVQMNDVSILLPLAKSTTEMSAYLAPSSGGVGGELLPDAVFEPVATAVGGINGTIDRDDLRAVAYRLDPCFAQIGPIIDPSKCDHQLRVVFQSIHSTSTGVSAQDDGVHAFYSLTPAEFDAALGEIVALRIANGSSSDLGALDVHPIVAKQGLTGAMGKGLANIVTKYAGKSNLSRITAFLGVFSQHTSWNFAATDIVKGKAVGSPIAGLADGTLSESISLGTAPTNLIQLGFLPTTTSDDVQPLLKATVEEDTDANRKAAYEAALRIENPGFHSPNTIDCVSCHTAEIARQLVGEDYFKFSSVGDANAFAQDAKYVTKTDMKTKYRALQPNGLAVNLHAFSWDGTKPMIIERVINETAAIVALVNSGTLAADAN